jgi:hypothetical protein
MLGFIENFEELGNILSTPNGRVLFTVHCVSGWGIVMIAILFVITLSGFNGGI